jgi:hypothetical protein
MEGDDTSELETLDSELVMSFYDQYHADEISKVYGDIEKSRLSRLYEELEKPADSSAVSNPKGGPDITTQPTQVANPVRQPYTVPVYYGRSFIVRVYRYR